MLSIQGLDVSYGPVPAVKALSLQVDRGEIVSLIGANGAGKSTVLRSVCGLTPVSGGKIYLNQQNITGMATEKIAKLGLAMVPEGRRIFQELTVLENLRLGYFTKKDTAEYDPAHTGRPKRTSNPPIVAA